MSFIPVIIVVIVVLIMISRYNNLIRQKNQVGNSSASVDALLKKRYDLLPNLVSTVQAYMQHEQTLLTEITKIRAKAASGQMSDDERVTLEKDCTS